MIQEAVRLTNLTVRESFKENLSPYVTVVDGSKVIVVSPIKAGSIVYSGEPIFYYSKSGDSCHGLIHSLYGLEREKLGKMASMVENLYPRTYDEKLSLMLGSAPHASEEVIKAAMNSVELHIESVAIANKYSSGNEYSVYGVGSKFNHSCYPNCLDMINKETHLLSIMAATDLCVGQECLICYNHSLLDEQDANVRRRVLREGLYFECACDYCTNDLKLPGIEALYFGCILTGRVRACSFCKILNITRKCSRCMKVSYCSKDCQRSHWPVHKACCGQ